MFWSNNVLANNNFLYGMNCSPLMTIFLINRNNNLEAFSPFNMRKSLSNMDLLSWVHLYAQHQPLILCFFISSILTVFKFLKSRLSETKCLLSNHYPNHCWNWGLFLFTKPSSLTFEFKSIKTLKMSPVLSFFLWNRLFSKLLFCHGE